MQKTPIYRTSRTALALMAVASSMPITVTSVSAGESSTGLSGLAQRTIVRRQNDIGEADRLLAEGREAYTKEDYQKALDKFTEALALPAFINKDAPNVSERYKCLLSHKCNASVALAIQYRKVGKYTEARELLAKANEISPDNFDVTRELAYLDDPIRTNPALTYEHTQNVDEVRRGLYKAEGNFNLGKFDEAKVEYQNVLRVDSYNTAARRGLERVSAAKSDYYRAAYDDARADLLGQVDAAWQLSVPVEAPPVDATRFGAGELSSGVAYITDKLKKIIIPKIDFEDTTVEEAIDFLRLRAGELDTQELEPSKKGVNFVIRRPRAAAPAADAGVDAAAGGATEALALTTTADPGSLRVRELRIRNVPLAVALKYICDQTKLRYKVDDFAVTLVPQAEQGEDVFTRSFTVPPDFQTQLDGGGAAAASGPADPFAEPDKGAAGKIKSRAPITELLKRSGVEFKENASANLSNSGVLLVTNTPTELDKIEQLVSAISGKQPKQVKVSTKFVEISQENGEELGFDWIVGPFYNSTNLVAGAGGTIGNGVPRTGVDFSGPAVPGVPTGNTNVSNIVTAGNRSGDGAINRNSIDSILNNPNRSSQTANVAPGIMSLTGLFSDSQLKLIMRGLSQKKGTDLMTAPSVTARSGQKATIEIIREFIYPTEYEPPEIPTSVGTGSTISGGLTGGSSSSSFPVTPATPTAFQTRNTGITLEIEPTIGENDFMIDLRFVPEIVEFEGFINYGSPIQSAGTDALGNSVQITLTENRIEMPVFSTRRVNTSLTIYDGYTVAIGGLMREDVQNVEDKVPILGDIPVIGRLFQTKAQNRIKSNLIIFVTAQIIDPTGRPLRGADATASIPAPSATGAGSMDPAALPPL